MLFMDDDKNLWQVNLNDVQKHLRGRVPDLQDIATYFYKHIGGPEEFAKLLVQDFKKSKAGSLVRTRIAAAILYATRIASEKQPPPKDRGLLSDEDIQAELEVIAKGFAKKGPDDKERAK